MGNLTKNLVLWLVIAMVLMAVFNNFTPKDSRTDVELDYSEFLHDVKQGGVEQVTIDGSSIHGRTRSGQRFVTYSPGDPGLVNDLLEAGVIIKAQKKRKHLLVDADFHQLVSIVTADRCVGILYAPDARWRGSRRDVVWAK